ncbi:autophagy-related protein 17 [Pyronema omphalodes]|nr:autophagy-related protein 17 [Pyronema omphalodes]
MPPPLSPSQYSDPHLDLHRSTNPDIPQIHIPPEELTTWFLNAKRSLTHVTLCSRAHVLVDNARGALQEANVISSRCGFLRSNLGDQLRISKEINKMMHKTTDVAHERIQETITKLEAAHFHLNQTLQHLKSFPVDPAFTNTTSPDDSEYRSDEHGQHRPDRLDRSVHRGKQPAQPSPPRRSLDDFVSHKGTEQISNSLRDLIDDSEKCHSDFTNSLGLFDSSLSLLSSSLASIPNWDPRDEPFHPPLNALEQRTEAMASLIQSLTQHFDRCGLALKGSESDMQVDPDLFHVLSRDAAQVDDVVAELKEILQEMEDISLGIDAKLGELRRFEDGIIGILVAFEDHQIELAAYLDGLRMFENRQKELKYDMEARLEELKAFREFYDGFRGAYDAMVVEVGRRQGVQVRMENIVKEAMRQIKELYDEDQAKREIFLEDNSDLLPVDIWAGIRDPPIRWEIIRDLQGGSELPQLGKDVIEKAMRRHNAAKAAARKL